LVVPDPEVDLQDIVLRRGDSVRVVALDPNGNPLRDAAVFAGTEPSLDSFKLIRGGMSMDRTGEDGTATLGGLLPGIYSLVGLSAGFAPALLEGVKVPFEEKASPVPLRFVKGGTLQVQVVQKSGMPVPDLVPRLTDDQGRNLTDLYTYLSTLAMDRFITDGDGRATLEGILPGEYLVSAGAGPKSEGRKVSITAGQTSSVVLTIDEEESD
jgi:hypothetical protein